MDLQESRLKIPINKLHWRVTLKMFIILRKKKNIFATLFLYLLEGVILQLDVSFTTCIVILLLAIFFTVINFVLIGSDHCQVLLNSQNLW